MDNLDVGGEAVGAGWQMQDGRTVDYGKADAGWQDCRTVDYGKADAGWLDCRTVDYGKADAGWLDGRWQNPPNVPSRAVLVDSTGKILQILGRRHGTGLLNRLSVESTK